MMPDTIDKRAEELYAVIFADWRSDIERIALIADALRKYVRRAVDRYWLMGSSEARARAVEEIFSED